MKSVFFLIGLSLLYSIDGQSQQKKLVPFKVMKGEQGKWGYKDQFTNKVIVYWHFDEALPFQNNGYARVKIGIYQTYIDTNGKLLFPFFYKNLPVALKDTIVIDAEKNRKLIKIGNDYWEYKKGKRRVDFPVRDYLGVKVLKDLLVFDYKTAKTVKELQESPITQKSAYTIKDNMELTMSLGKISNYPDKWVDASVTHIQCMNFLNFNNKMRGLAMGAGYYHKRLSSDSFDYRFNLITFGVMQRISFGKNAIFSVDIGIHPVVSGSAFYRAINIKTPGNFNTTSGPWLNYESPTKSIQAITELGFTVKASELFRVGVAMRGIPAGITALPASQTILLKASFSW